MLLIVPKRRRHALSQNGGTYKEALGQPGERRGRTAAKNLYFVFYRKEQARQGRHA